MLCSINPNTCSTLALVFDFSLLFYFCWSVNGLFLYPISCTLLFISYLPITFSWSSPVNALSAWKSCPLYSSSSKSSRACESCTEAPVTFYSSSSLISGFNELHVGKGFKICSNVNRSSTWKCNQIFLANEPACREGRERERTSYD